MWLDGARDWSGGEGISQGSRRPACAYPDRRLPSFEFTRARNKRMNISAVLLAGGKSSRMGEDKATILFRGAPLWKIQLDLLRKLQSEELLVSAQINPPWLPADAQFVADEE